RKCRLDRLADAGPAALGMIPDEKRQCRAGRADLVAVIEMPAARIVEIDGALDEPQPQHAGIERDMPPRISGNAGDVVDASRRHRSSRRCVARAYAGCGFVTLTFPA